MDNQNYKHLNNCGLNVFALGLGTMRFNKRSSTGDIDDRRAIDIVKYAIQKGINYIDTAYTYHNGKSEIIVGEAIKIVRRDSIFLTTKCPVWEIDTEIDFFSILHQQLKRLDTPYIDCYLLHALGKERWEHVKSVGIMSMMKKAQQMGLIHHIGFSFHDEFGVFKRIIDEYDGWEICQLQYNYVDTEKQAGKKGIEYAKSKGLDVIIMEPLHGGRLVDLPPQVAKVFPPYKSCVEWAFDYLYDDSNIDLVLSGMNSEDQIDTNISIASNAYPGMLTELEHQNYVIAKKIYDSMSLVLCTDCGYCLPCKMNIEIPRIMSLYNKTGTGHYREAKIAYDKLSIKASVCIQCKQCEKRCPQNINISKEMIKIASIFTKPVPPIDLEALKIKWPARYKKIMESKDIDDI